MPRKRVVITGIGTINPLGNNVAEYFRNLDRGISGARIIDRLDTTFFATKFACQIPDYDPLRFPEAIDRKEVRRTDPFTQYAMIAAAEAVRDSRLDDGSVDLKRIGVVVGSGVGGINTYTEEIKEYFESDRPRFSPFLIPKFITNIASGHIAIKYGFRGPNFGVSSACATFVGSSFGSASGFSAVRSGKAKARARHASAPSGPAATPRPRKPSRSRPAPCPLKCRDGSRAYGCARICSCWKAPGFSRRTRASHRNFRKPPGSSCTSGGK